MEERPTIVTLESAELRDALEFFVAEEPRFSRAAKAEDARDGDDLLSLFSSEHRLILVEAAKEESLGKSVLPTPVDEDVAFASRDKAVRFSPRRVAVAILVGGALVASAAVGVVVHGRFATVLPTTTAVAPPKPVAARVSRFIESRALAPAAEPMLAPIVSPRLSPRVIAIGTSGTSGTSGTMARPPSSAERPVPFTTKEPERPASPPATIASVRQQAVAASPSSATISLAARGREVAGARAAAALTETAPTASASTPPSSPESAPPTIPPAVTAPAPTAAAPLPTPIAESGAIQSVLDRYRSAFSGLDVGDARAVWPSVDAKALAKAFDQLEEQDVTFDSCQISIIGARATASCGGSARYVPKIGNRTERVDTHRWKFNLRRINEAWLIESVESR